MTIYIYIYIDSICAYTTCLSLIVWDCCVCGYVWPRFPQVKYSEEALRCRYAQFVRSLFVETPGTKWQWRLTRPKNPLVIWTRTDFQKKVRIWYFARPWRFVLGRLLTYVIYNNRHRMKRYERYQSNNSMWTNDLDWGCSFWRGRGRSTQLLQIHFLCHPKYCVIAILQPGRHHQWYQGIFVFSIYIHVLNRQHDLLPSRPRICN